MSDTHPTRAIIDLGAFRHNLSCVRSYCDGKAGIMAVVKANGYGHGVIELSRTAVIEGVEYLAVARIDEALEIRRAGITHPLVVFEIAPHSLIAGALAENIQLTVSTIEGAEAISRAAARRGHTAKVHVKVDTGMTRMGFDERTAADQIESMLLLPRLELASLYSHFATSEDEDKSFARGQLHRFNGVIELLRLRGIEVPFRHMANSGAIISMPEAHLDVVRPGIMLYGYTPASGMTERFPVRPVMSLVSAIAMLRTVEEGTSVSYGRRYFTKNRTTIATVPLGYADGYSRLLTNRTYAIVRGRRYPVVGTICMDQLMLDLGLDEHCSVGDIVTLIGTEGGEAITAWNVAEITGTIPYEVTSLVTGRVPRIFQE